jgi:hypothetical protein
VSGQQSRLSRFTLEKEKPRHPWNRRFGRPQERSEPSGGEKNVFIKPGFKLETTDAALTAASHLATCGEEVSDSLGSVTLCLRCLHSGGEEQVSSGELDKETGIHSEEEANKNMRTPLQTTPTLRHRN